MYWNLTIIDDKIILYSKDYEYLIELTRQIDVSSNYFLQICLKNRNNKYELRITDDNCNIFRLKENNFAENNYLVVKGDRHNIISYKGLPKIYRYEKKEFNPYYQDMDYGFYGKPKLEIDKRLEVKITDDIINKFVTKEVYDYIPSYMVLY